MATRQRGFTASGTEFDVFGEVRELHASRQADYESTRRPIRDYAELIPEPGFGVLDFERFPYLLEPFYSDVVAQATEVVYKKSTQIGASTGLWRWGVRESDQYGRTCIYTFPTQDNVNEFGDERIEPAIEASEYLQSRIPPHFVHTKKLKRIGRGWIYFRGAQSRSGAQSVGAQSIVFDEYDELPPAIVGQFERRLTGAKQTGKAPRLRRAGIPRFPGGPMDAAYQGSDRREWIVQCPECGERQPIAWSANVRWTMPGEDFEGATFRAGHDADPVDDRKIVGDVWRACKDCETSLEGDPLLAGEWVAQNPGHPVLGFYIHRLIVADVDLAQMVVASRGTSPSEIEAFHSNDLGEAYAATEAALTEEDVNRAASFGMQPQVPTYGGLEELTAGIDVASERNLNYRIDAQFADGTRRAVRIGEARSFSEMKDLLVAYRVSVAVIDGMPERRLARGLAAELPGRVHIAVFVDSKFDPKTEPEPLSYDPKRNLVTLHRTMLLDAMMDSVRHCRAVPTVTLPPGYMEQMTAPQRVTEYDSQERPRRVYRTPSGRADDYAMSDSYALAASEMWRLRKQVEWQQAMANQQVPDAALGIERGGLDALGSDGELRDDYKPGFGRGW